MYKKSEYRPVLWIVGSAVFGFAYLAAGYASVTTHPSITQLYAQTYCRTFNPFRWFSSYAYCSDLVAPRLGILLIGGAVLAVCAFFAERPVRNDEGRRLVNPGAFPDVPRNLLPYIGGPPWLSLAGGHDDWDLTPDGFESVCVACGKKVPDRERERAHQLETGGLPAAASGSTSDGVREEEAVDAEVGIANTRSDDYKTCPDCAEQVRAAARVCRFCRYEFRQST